MLNPSVAAYEAAPVTIATVCESEKVSTANEGAAL
jgi:hypothetical protein